MQGMIGIVGALVFITVIAVFVMVFAQMIGTWHKNNNSPRLTVAAQVVAKRSHVSHSHGDGLGGYTSYYVTFQVESGDRMELHVEDSEYGMLAEGDYGLLSFQGTRYLGFERNRM